MPLPWYPSFGTRYPKSLRKFGTQDLGPIIRYPNVRYPLRHLRGPGTLHLVPSVPGTQGTVKCFCSHTVHEGQKDHNCDACGKSFSHVGKLKRHIHTVHDGYKDHKCGYCAKSFSEARGLKNHVKREHDD